MPSCPHRALEFSTRRALPACAACCFCNPLTKSTRRALQHMMQRSRGPLSDSTPKGYLWGHVAFPLPQRRAPLFSRRQIRRRPDAGDESSADTGNTPTTSAVPASRILRPENSSSRFARVRQDRANIALARPPAGLACGCSTMQSRKVGVHASSMDYDAVLDTSGCISAVASLSGHSGNSKVNSNSPGFGSAQLSLIRRRWA